jgi:hypothetical protein
MFPLGLQGYELKCNANGTPAEQYVYVVGDEANCDALVAGILTELAATPTLATPPPPPPSTLPPTDANSRCVRAVDSAEVQLAPSLIALLNNNPNPAHASNTVEDAYVLEFGSQAECERLRDKQRTYSSRA